MQAAERQGRLFVVSAPSGTGKTTVVSRLIERVPSLRVSRSYASRAPRGGEVDGVDYAFVSRQTFEAMIAGGEFLEWASVFGNYYGTGRADTDRVLGAGHDLVLVIDVQGARQVRDCRACVSIFLLPPSADALEARLRGRSQDADETIRRRLERARDEVAAYREYDYVVINDDVDRCVDRLSGIVTAERCRPDVMSPQVEGVLRTFGVRAVEC